MRIAFFVNSIGEEHPRYTTTLLALTALARDHQVAYLTPDDFVLRADDRLMVRVRRLPETRFKKVETLLKALQSDDAVVETVDVTEFDVLMLRNDPAQDGDEHPWAAHAGPMFGRLAADRGVLVVNDPEGLSLAQNKLYLQGFPQAVRPLTLISKNIDEIRDFVAVQPDGVIVKPLQGSGGRNVFRVASAEDANLNQIFEAVSEEGYLIAQAYLPEATEGDVRLFVMNGAPLERDGTYAALRRVPAKGDLRSNMHAKGTAARAKISRDVLGVVELVRPKLIQDGMFLVGLDIVGDKVLEINVFTPGALWSICQLEKTDFAASVVASLEQKVNIRAGDTGNLTNRALAAL
jgi:glutathione synthase